MIALALSTVSLWIVGARPRFESLHELADAAARRVFSAHTTSRAGAGSLRLIGAAVRFLDRPSAFWRYLADASFFVYIIHLPIVYALQTWMIRWPLHWSVKYALIVTLTTCHRCSRCYHYLVRSTFVGKFLNGRKYPRGMPATSVPSTSPG